MTASELSRLVALDISKTREAFLDLPLPEESALIGTTPKVLRRAADNFYQAWTYLRSDRDLYLRGEATAPSTGEKLRQRDLWSRLFLIIGSYYDFSIRLLVSAGEVRKSGTHPIPGLGVTYARDWLPRLAKQNLNVLLRELDLVRGGNLPEEEARKLTAKLFALLEVTRIEEVPDAIVWETYRDAAGLLAGNYITAMFAGAFGELLRNSNISHEAIEEMDGIAHSAASKVHAFAQDLSEPNFVKLSERFLTTIFQQWGNIYDQARWDETHKAGPFSAIRVSELAPLANRDARMVAKYGRKRIEKIFEQQLALIVQSFGLYVVSTRTGQRTVDLICISADPTARFTFLLEAKTSGRPYALPRDDARALLEYIREVRGGLTTLPPLHFVLMIGPYPSATLEKKLQGLEAEAGLPIRYCSADELAQLREVVAGPLPLNDFADHLLLASRVVPAGFAQTMRSRVDELRSSHEALVRTMLAPVR
jgi:hypothetical protein